MVDAGQRRGEQQADHLSAVAVEIHAVHHAFAPEGLCEVGNLQEACCFFVSHQDLWGPSMAPVPREANASRQVPLRQLQPQCFQPRSVGCHLAGVLLSLSPKMSDLSKHVAELPEGQGMKGSAGSESAWINHGSLQFGDGRLLIVDLDFLPSESEGLVVELPPGLYEVSGRVMDYRGDRRVVRPSPAFLGRIAASPKQIRRSGAIAPLQLPSPPKRYQPFRHGEHGTQPQTTGRTLRSYEPLRPGGGMEKKAGRVPEGAQ